MERLDLKILKFLSENDNGEYLDVRKAFTNDKTPSWIQLQRIFNDLNEYIDVESIYNYRGIRNLNPVEPEPNIENLKCCITQKGREYYNEYVNTHVSMSISKKNLYIAFAGFILGLVALYFTVINPILFKRNENAIDDQSFPNLSMILENQTEDTLTIFSQQDLIIWFPADAFGNARTITSRYEIISKEIKGELLALVPGKKIKVVAKFLNKMNLYKYFQTEEDEISLIVKTQNHGLTFSENIPFRKSWFEKYFVTAIFKKK